MCVCSDRPGPERDLEPRVGLVGRITHLRMYRQPWMCHHDCAAWVACAWHCVRVRMFGVRVRMFGVETPLARPPFSYRVLLKCAPCVCSCVALLSPLHRNGKKTHGGHSEPLVEYSAADSAAEREAALCVSPTHVDGPRALASPSPQQAGLCVCVCVPAPTVAREFGQSAFDCHRSTISSEPMDWCLVLMLCWGGQAISLRSEAFALFRLIRGRDDPGLSCPRPMRRSLVPRATCGRHYGNLCMGGTPRPCMLFDRSLIVAIFFVTAIVDETFASLDIIGALSVLRWRWQEQHAVWVRRTALDVKCHKASDVIIHRQCGGCMTAGPQNLLTTK